MKVTVEELKRLHDMQDTLRALGASDEDMITLWKIALETADKIIKEA